MLHKFLPFTIYLRHHSRHQSACRDQLGVKYFETSTPPQQGIEPATFRLSDGNSLPPKLMSPHVLSSTTYANKSALSSKSQRSLPRTPFCFLWETLRTTADPWESVPSSRGPSQPTFPEKVPPLPPTCRLNSCMGSYTFQPFTGNLSWLWKAKGCCGGGRGESGVLPGFFHDFDTRDMDKSIPKTVNYAG